jgi:hypothetical protein
MDDITIGVTEFVNNISVSAQPNDQIIDITVTETVETVLLDVSTTVEEVTVTATQNVIVENITVDYVNNENNIDINVTDGTQDVTLNITPTLVEINILRSGGEVNILQFNTLADFPATGSSDYFYLAKDTNKLYRWTGSAYAEISATSSPVWGQIIGTLSEQTDLQNALNLKAPINSPTFTGTVSGITKVMVGLGAVDNTSDLDKPISTATQTALNAKQPLDADLTSIAALSNTFGLLKKTANNSYTIDTNTYLTGITSSDVTTALGYTPENVANKGVNNGYASLGGDGKVPSSQLPSYVDDVIEVSSFGTLPTTGETGKIYITLDTNKIYRWSGSVYVEVSSSAAVWGGITGTLSAQTDLQSALNAKENTITAGTTAQYYRGDKSFQTLDTSVVPEGSNLYFTDARVNANGNVSANTAARHNAVTLGTANGLSLATQVLSLGLASGSTTGALSSTDWTTFNNKYPASNPNGYTSNVGTVTSVALTVPSAFSVSGSPITSSGTLAITGAGDTTQYIAGDGSLITFPTAGQSGTLVREVRNTTGATLTKGTIVYISGATGNKPTVSKAIATSDSTSAQTFGMVQANIANNANGNVVCVGDLTGLDTSAFTEGAQLYLSSTTAGTYTTTKQLAPNHLVYIGVVTRAHPTQGQIEVNIQNGYELYELHDVSITSETNNQGLFYEASTDLWKNKSIATVLGYTPANGADYVALSGTQTIAGNKYFTGFGLFDNTIFIKQDSSVSFLAGYNSIDSDSTGIIFSLPAGNMAKFILTSLTASRDYTLPNTSGTIALTSDIPSLAGYVATTGNQSIAGDKTFSGSVINDGDLYIKQDASYAPKTGYVNLFAGAGNILTYNFGNSNTNQSLSFPTNSRVYSFPDATGTLALTSDLHNAVTIGTANGLSLSTQVLSLALASTSTTGALSSTDWNTFNGKQNALTNPVTGTGTTSYITKFTGTSAVGNSLLYDTGSVLLVGATSASDGQSKLELVSAGTVGLKIISSGANGNNTFLSIQASKEWRFLTNRGDLIAGNQGDLIIRNDTDSINHIILNQGGSTTFAGAVTATNYVASGGNNTTVFNSAAATTGWVQMAMNNTSGSSLFGVEGATAGTLATGTLAYASVLRNYTNTAFQIATNNTVRLTVTSAGNVGIGTTAPGTQFETTNTHASDVIPTSGVAGSTTTAFLTQGTVQKYGLIIGTTYTAGAVWLQSKYRDTTGTLPLSLQPLGGNVGIGTTAPSRLLNVLGGGSNGILVTGFNSVVTLPTNGLSLNTGYNVGYITNYTAAGALGDLYYKASKHIFTDGPVLVNTSSSAASVFKLQVGDGTTDSRAFFQPSNPFAIGVANGGSSAWYIGVNAQTAANGLQFYSNELGAAAVTITTAGTVGIGTTAPLTALDRTLTVFGTGIFQTTTGAGNYNENLRLNRNTGNGYASLALGGAYNSTAGTGTGQWTLAATPAALSYRLDFDYNGATKGYIDPSSGVYVVLSDYNKKKDFENSSVGLNAIMGLKPKLFRMKDEEQTIQKQLGFVAQEVKDFIPQAYVETVDGFIGLQDRPMIAALTKAVQELKAELDTLKNK